MKAFRITTLLIASLTGLNQGTYAQGLAWPTPNRAFIQKRSIQEYIQPTSSGKVISGLFGCTRNNGHKFHEGIDLFPIERDKKREATDDIYAIMPGTVVHISPIAGKSSYGRYVVIEHDDVSPALCSLYAHLAPLDGSLKVGQKVAAGQTIATMGRSSSGYVIPKSRAHLHLEIGLRLSNQFENWYQFKKLTPANPHGLWSGLNIVGSDPIQFFEHSLKNGKVDAQDFLWQQPVATTLLVSTRIIPDFVRRYPALLTHPVPKTGLTGWKIDFSGYGLPTRWTPLTAQDTSIYKEGGIYIIAYNKDLLRKYSCRSLLNLSKPTPQIGSTLTSYLQLLFGFR